MIYCGPSHTRTPRPCTRWVVGVEEHAVRPRCPGQTVYRPCTGEVPPCQQVARAGQNTEGTSVAGAGKHSDMRSAWGRTHIAYTRPMYPTPEYTHTHTYTPARAHARTQTRTQHAAHAIAHANRTSRQYKYKEKQAAEHAKVGCTRRKEGEIWGVMVRSGDVKTACTGRRACACGGDLLSSVYPCVSLKSSPFSRI